ncbi:hypothetical protein AB4156_40830, partial [Cupriavidus sp. 2MCAB6]|uniref:hypothetical protein n=1 Tax=Cupriavidus sp. 2MCAB6 TaxID=3232981 RepID=UPI003F92378A
AIVWRVGDGRDVVNGGANGTVGDAFSITGDNSDEVFSIYSRFEWLKVAGNLASDLNANTDIVITRNGTGTASVVAELDQIEEISINTGGGNDSVLVVGNLTPSDLRFNTITVNSGTGDDTVDVTALESAHHVVLNTGGGSDHLVGMRAQDEMHVTGPAAAGGSTGGGGSNGGGSGNGSGSGSGNETENGGGNSSGSETENGGGSGSGNETENGGGGTGNETGNGGGGS